MAPLAALVDALRRPRVAALAAGAGTILVVLVTIVALRACGGADEAPPAGGAARLVPGDALLYVNLSTDRDRAATRRAFELLQRFPSLPRVRDDLFRRLETVRPGLSFRRDVQPWLGDEAALALLNTTGPAAGSLLVLDVANRRRAQSFLDRTAGAGAPSRYSGTRIAKFGDVATAFVGRYLVIGQEPGVRAAIDGAAGRGATLARNAAFKRATAGQPADRAASVYASPDGVARLLAPQGGALGAAGALLDQPGLAGTSMSLSARADGARISVHSVLERARGRGRPARARQFDPALVEEVPAGAMAYIGLTGLDRAASRLLAAGLAGGGTGQRLTALLTRARRDLSRRTGVDVRRDVLPLFQGEVALWLGAATPSPILTLISRTRDERATREAFAQLQAPLARLFAPPDSGPGQAPVFEERNVNGATAFALRLAPGVELDYAVFDGKLVISTALNGIRRVRAAKGSIEDEDSFRVTLGDRPEKVTSLTFLDFSQLLRLAEHTGLTESQAYLRIREDLRQIKALGAAASGGETDSTTELFLQIT